MANFTAIQWGFTPVRGAAFLWMNKLPDTKIVQSKVCLVWIHGDVHDLNFAEQRLIESTGQNEKLAPEGMRQLINEIYGDKDAIEIYSEEPSPGWDVWMPK